ncbi:molecular chaperone TorD family protein [Deltaproteobacteria bacterium TL4]
MDLQVIYKDNSLNQYYHGFNEHILPGQIALFRHVAYRFLSVWYLYPSQTLFEIIQDSVQFLRQHYDETASNFYFFKEWSAFLDVCEELEPRGLEAFQQEYQRLFGGNPSQSKVSLYESDYSEAAPSNHEKRYTLLRKKYLQVLGMSPYPFSQNPFLKGRYNPLIPQKENSRTPKNSITTPDHISSEMEIICVFSVFRKSRVGNMKNGIYFMAHSISSERFLNNTFAHGLK